jgi:hypothetical protein
MRRISIASVLLILGMGLIAVPVLANPPTTLLHDCDCSSETPGSQETCGQCDTGKVAIPTGCTQCCAGANHDMCSSTDGTGT